MANNSPIARNPQQKPVRVIAVTSGKGGVGKTNISVNLAASFAKKGDNVLLMDADLGLANVDILFDLHPKFDLRHVIAGERSLDEIIVEIDPGMAFGTGTHPTTALCIRMLEKQLLTGQRILDVGTGSGILLITAAKLGAGSGIGIDNDRVATTVVSSNLAQNHLDPARFSVVAGNLIDTVTGQFDLVIANILTDVILGLIPSLHRVVKPRGLFICSGIIEAYEKKVNKKLQASGFQQVEKLSQDDWVCIAARTGGRI